MEGRRFGQLVVLTRVGRDKFRCATWYCVCDCGNSLVTSGPRLRSGGATSCGHTRAPIQHGHTTEERKSPEYVAYGNAKARCTNPHYVGWKYYGGRGIEFRFNSFEEFLTELGFRPAGCTLDRINPDGHYEKGNIRWATWKVQANNRRKVYH